MEIALLLWLPFPILLWSPVRARGSDAASALTFGDAPRAKETPRQRRVIRRPCAIFPIRASFRWGTSSTASVESVVGRLRLAMAYIRLYARSPPVNCTSYAFGAL